MSLLVRLFPWLSCLVLGLVIWGLQSQLTAEREFRSSVQAQLHAPNDKPETLSAYLTGAIEAKNAGKAALKQIDQDAIEEKRRSTAADAQLDQVQQSNLKKVAGLQAALTNLKNHKTAGNLVDDCVVIEEDSKLPWKGWHQ